MTETGSLPAGQGGWSAGEMKVTGQMRYAADVDLPGMLHAVVVRSPYPHARITSIDVAQAERMPGVACVLTGKDVADIRYGRLVRDVPVLAAEKVRFVGERVAAVAAQTLAQAEEAAAAITVAYEPLPAVFDPDEALCRDAPAVHAEPWRYAGAVVEPGEPANLQARHVRTGGGDVEAALTAAEFRFEQRFQTPATHQGYLEPHSCIAAVEADGQIQIWASTKGPYRLRSQVAKALGVPEQAILVNPLPLGGDFGGKGSPMDVPLCVELARRTRHPVSITMRYAEELMAACPRHASAVTVRAGVDRNGRLQAMDIRIVLNTGAYAGFRPGGTLHGAEEAAAAYRIPAFRNEILHVYTNQVSGGHKRAPGAVQAVFAVESMLDIIAAGIGMDPAELRLRNLLSEQNPTTPLGERWLDARGVETLECALRADRPAFPASRPASLRFGRGVALYCRPTRIGVTSLRLRATAEGQIVAEIPPPDQGSGGHKVFRSVLAGALNVPLEQIVVRHVGTDQLPDDDGVSGSRVTASASEVAHQAAGLLRARLRAAAAEPGQEITVLAQTERRRGPAENPLGFCVQIAQVGVDVETGQLFTYELLTVHDVAEIINPRSHRVQIEGGVAFGLGEALLEDLEIREGKVGAANLGDYKLPSIRDVPPVRIAYLTGGRGVGVANVKGIGEMSNVPVAAALANAVADAVGVRITSLPITAEKIYAALQQGAGREG